MKDTLPQDVLYNCSERSLEISVFNWKQDTSHRSHHWPQEREQNHVPHHYYKSFYDVLLIIFPVTFEFVYNEHVRHKFVYTIKVVWWAQRKVLIYMWHLLTHSFTCWINYGEHSMCQALGIQSQALCEESQGASSSCKS